MEQAYDGKCVFLTGGTGFLGKVCGSHWVALSACGLC